MSSKTFRIILAGDAKGATNAIKDAQKAGDGLIGASSGWGGKWSGVFASMGQKLADFGARFRDADGWKAKLGTLGGEGSSALSGLGSAFQNVGSMAALGAAAGIAALGSLAAAAASKAQEIGTYLYGLGESMYAAQGIIRVGTGATGAELGDLNEQLDVVYSQSTRSREELATGMTTLKQILEVPYDQLDDLTLGVNRLSNVTKTDFLGNIKAISPAFENWHLSTEQQIAANDQLFRVWQETGMLPAEIAAQMQQAGPALRDFGFSWEESLALLGGFADNGIQSQTVISGLSKALNGLAKENAKTADYQAKVTDLQNQYNAAVAEGGEGSEKAVALSKKLAAAEADLSGAMESADIEGVFRDRIKAIQNAGSEAEANALGIEMFGKSNVAMVDAIRSGNFDIEAMYELVAGGEDTLKAAASDTGSWRSALTMMVHTLETKLRPAAEAVFGMINNVIRNNIMPLFRGLSAAWDEGGFEGVVERLPVVLDLIKLKLAEWWDTATAWLSDHGDEILDAISGAIRTGLAAGGELTAALGDLLVTIGNWFQETAWPYVEAHWGEWWKAFTDSFDSGGFMNQMLLKLGEILANISIWFVTDAIPWAFVKGWELLIALTKWLGTDGVPTAIAGIGALIGSIVEWIETEGISKITTAASSFWHALFSPFESLYNQFIDWWNGLDVFFGDADLIPDIGITASKNGIPMSFDVGMVTIPTAVGMSTKSKKSPISHIPGFATGGFVSSPTLAVVGEGRPEHIVADDKLRRAIRDEVGSGTIVVKVVLDEREIGEAIVPALRRREMAFR